MGQNPSKNKGGSSSSSSSASSFTSSVLAAPGALLDALKGEAMVDFRDLADGTKVNLYNVCELFDQRRTASGEAHSKEEKILEKDTEALFRMIEDQFHRILSSKIARESLLSLSREALVMVLMSDRLQAPDEYQLFLLVGAWCDKRIEAEREGQIEEKSAAETLYGKPEKPKQGEEEKVDTTEAKDSEKQKVEEESKEDKKEEPKEEEEEKKTTTERRGLSDSDFARQIQEEMYSEMSSQEAEDEQFAKQLFNIWNEEDDDNSNGVVKKDDFKIPDWKLTDEYLIRLMELLEPLLEYIRFPYIAPSDLKTMYDDGMVPTHLLNEAWKYQYYMGTEVFNVDKNNIRMRARRYMSVEWDPLKVSAGVILSNMNRTISSNSGCSHKTVLGKNGISTGFMSFEILLEGNAGCYSAVGVCGTSFNRSEVLGIGANSWAFAMYPGGHSPQGPNRVSLSSQLKQGNRIRVCVDMDRKALYCYLNGDFASPVATITGLSGTVYPALCICHTSPVEKYTLITPGATCK